jgi:hypothetical protein
MSIVPQPVNNRLVDTFICEQIHAE